MQRSRRSLCNLHNKTLLLLFWNSRLGIKQSSVVIQQKSTDCNADENGQNVCQTVGCVYNRYRLAHPWVPEKALNVQSKLCLVISSSRRNASKGAWSNEGYPYKQGYPRYDMQQHQIGSNASQGIDWQEIQWRKLLGCFWLEDMQCNRRCWDASHSVRTSTFALGHSEAKHNELGYCYYKFSQCYTNSR